MAYRRGDHLVRSSHTISYYQSLGAAVKLCFVVENADVFQWMLLLKGGGER